MREHNFKDSKDKGDRYEAWFHRWAVGELGCKTEPTPDVAADKLGIDGVLRFPFQVKADEQAAATGNVFVETWSDKERNVRGWAYTTDARIWFFYLIPGKGEILRVDWRRLRACLPGWERSLPERTASNGRWTTAGVCVPIEQFRREATSETWISANLYAMLNSAA